VSKIILGNEGKGKGVILGVNGEVLAGKVKEVEKKSEWDVTVKDLASELGILPKSLRSRLRKNGYKKAGKEWGWMKNSKELAEIRKKFKSE
jgi:hypothetical protein